jgi:transposase
MRKIREVLRLKYECGFRHRAIARTCGLGVGTVSDYVGRAARCGLSWPLPAELDEQALEARLFTQAAPLSERAAPDCAWIHQELRKTGVTLHLLWSEYRATHPDGYAYSQFCVIYRRWAGHLKLSMRQTHRAGEKTFIDYSGKRPEIVNPQTGEMTAVELFVAVLGASNYTYAEATRTQQMEEWVAAHTRMLEYFGGASEIWVPDQLKSAITQPCRYEAGVNRSYQDLAHHYGAVVVPARPAAPRDKAKVESAVLVTQRWILARLRNRTFFSLEELNVAIRVLLDDLNNRPMQKIGKSRREQWEALDRPALKPLPANRFELARWKPCRVNIDYHIEVERHLYSVPYQLVHARIEVRYTAAIIEIFHQSRRVASHMRRFDGRPTTLVEHMPRSHRAHAEWTPSRLIHWAEKIGPAAGRLVAGILERRPHPEQGYRSCLGLLRLGKQYGALRLEAACERAEYLRSYSYRTVKNILAASQDRLSCGEETTAHDVTPAHDNIRGAGYYAATQEDEC